MFFKNLLVTGGAGYCGSVLVPQLLKLGHRVRVFDTFYFGNYLPKNYGSSLEFIEGDIRDSKNVSEALTDIDAVIHLACISNDASFELDESLSTEINLKAFEPLVEASRRAGVKRFIYASSSSVYGVSSKSNVTEDHPLVPLTLYNKYKGMCEPILFSHTNEQFEGVIFRPATVCGFSPRQRLDLSVNILTNLAINERRITVFGGEQMRPNLHIQDYCDVVKLLLVADSSKIKNQIFNVGAENLTILEIANKVKNIVEQQFKGDPISIEMTKSDDNRSYHINSDKIFDTLGYKPKLSLERAVLDLCNAFKDGLIPNSLSDECYFNVKSLKKLNIR
jgi:nucleoside-diphosphate-sugar epimerase